ncbi:hypothetical protein BUE67_15140, partial [Corynebacterium diphtheriae]
NPNQCCYIRKIKPLEEVLGGAIAWISGLRRDQSYDLIDRVKERFPKLRIEMKKPELTLEEQAEKYNPALWKNNPNQCCYIRKIKPLEEVLGGAIAWISGLRRDQS